MYEYIMNFFKEMGFYNQNYFNKIKKKTIVVDEDYEDIKEFVGFYPENFKLILPKIKTTRDVLIWIHEYSHALFPNDNDEIFPNLMEAYFINMYVFDKDIVDELISNTELEIINSKDEKHKIAKKIKLNSINYN